MDMKNNDTSLNTSIVADSYPETDAIRILWMVFSPVLLVVGTLGNALSVVIYGRKGMRKLSSSYLLACLAIVDTVVLYAGPLRWWIQNWSGRDIASATVGFCKLSIFTEYMGADTAAWILVSLTSQRFIGVWFPVKAQILCTTRKSAVLLIGILVACFVKNSHFVFSHWSLGSDSVAYGNLSGYFGCTALDSDYSHFLLVIWPNLDMALSAFVPFAILLGCNTLIILKMGRRHKHRLNSQQVKDSGQSTKKIRGMNIMLLVTSFAFLLLQMPLFIYLIGEAYWKAGKSAAIVAKVELGRAIVDILYYSTYAINFLLYCISGPSFRKEVKVLFRRHTSQQVEPAAETDTQSVAKPGKRIALAVTATSGVP